MRPGVDQSGTRWPGNPREAQLQPFSREISEKGEDLPPVVDRGFHQHRVFDCSLFMLGYNYVSTDIKCEKEAWVYPVVSFIAELGGSLGLFVGFSFLAFWDCFDFALTKYRYHQISE